ncbi:hypothetical protein J3D47_003794 [Pseudomonas laurylsulfativorans]|nr:hypothetical protein [Pseudomonas laurylsulfativorans]MCP1419551.1 hypothetical protein [Pseudomonas laurylsulfativorans]
MRRPPIWRSPPTQVIATLFTLQPQSHAVDRIRTRSWSNIKNGN